MLARKRRTDEPVSYVTRARQDFQGRIFSGLMILIPLGITVFILNFLFAITVGSIVELLDALPWENKPKPYVINVLAFFLLIIVLYTVGHMAANMVGRRLIAIGESILTRIPLVKTIYSASKQVVETFSLKDKATTFRAAALVEFPSKGIRSLGFITGTVVDEHGRQCYRVFIPTTPNPTTGYLLVMKPEDVCPTDISIEEACKILMSGGIIFPEDFAHRILPPAASLSHVEPASDAATDEVIDAPGAAPPGLIAEAERVHEGASPRARKRTNMAGRKKP